MAVLALGDVSRADVAALLARYGVKLEVLGDGAPIAGSYWGEREAGLIRDRLLARADTPLHSILHEAAHFICMSPRRRVALDTDAGGDDLEECAVCYLQIVLADFIPGFGRGLMLSDMDAWGYSFRLAAARAWFEQDAEDARRWLAARGLIDSAGTPTWRLNGASAAA